MTLVKLLKFPLDNFAIRTIFRIMYDFAIF